MHVTPLEISQYIEASIDAGLDILIARAEAAESAAQAEAAQEEAKRLAEWQPVIGIATRILPLWAQSYLVPPTGGVSRYLYNDYCDTPLILRLPDLGDIHIYAAAAQAPGRLKDVGHAEELRYFVPTPQAWEFDGERGVEWTDRSVRGESSFYALEPSLEVAIIQARDAAELLRDMQERQAEAEAQPEPAPDAPPVIVNRQYWQSEYDDLDQGVVPAPPSVQEAILLTLKELAELGRDMARSLAILTDELRLAAQDQAEYTYNPNAGE